MPVTLELILFILLAISAVGYLVKEFQKTRKRTIGILLEFLVLFWSIWRISTIIFWFIKHEFLGIKSKVRITLCYFRKGSVGNSRAFFHDLKVLRKNEIFTTKIIIKYFTPIHYNGIVIVYWH